MTAEEIVPSHTFSVAPMMEVTDRHWRSFWRLISRRSKLYTEMVVDQTLLHQAPFQEKWLGHCEVERPLAVQLGGNDPEKVASAAEMCEMFGGYSEINLNCGCPSPRVSQNCFGARLMLDPELTRRVVHGMVRRVTATPITVKCRIGADDHDSYEHLVKFVAGVQSAGVKEIAVHARKCLLKGLCPRQNRTIPPLRYDVVRQLKADFPELTIVLNGGIKNMSDVMGHLQWQGREEDECPGATVDGVMVGRAAYQDTWSFATTDSLLFGEQSDPASSRRAVIDSYMDYVESYLESSDPNPKFKIETLVKPLQGIFHGLSGSKRFRGSLFAGLREISWSDGSANVREVLDRSLEHMPASVLLDPPGVTWTRTGADGEGRSPRMNE